MKLLWSILFPLCAYVVCGLFVVSYGAPRPGGCDGSYPTGGGRLSTDTSHSVYTECDGPECTVTLSLLEDDSGQSGEAESQLASNSNARVRASAGGYTVCVTPRPGDWGDVSSGNCCVDCD